MVRGRITASASSHLDHHDNIRIWKGRTRRCDSCQRVRHWLIVCQGIRDSPKSGTVRLLVRVERGLGSVVVVAVVAAVVAAAGGSGGTGRGHGRRRRRLGNGNAFDRQRVGGNLGQQVGFKASHGKIVRNQRLHRQGQISDHGRYLRDIGEYGVVQIAIHAGE